MRFALACGNPQDGFEFVGPFASPDEAIDYGEQTRDSDWHVVSLIEPIEKLAHEVVEERMPEHYSPDRNERLGASLMPADRTGTLAGGDH